jgi:hypothetical protein
MEMPKKVYIGTQVWSIVQRSRTSDGMLSDESFGYTLNKENVIVIDSQITPSRKKQTLVHELLHAIRFTFNNPSVPKKTEDVEVWEHYFIGAYEEGLLLLLRDNPALLDYLLEKE